MSAIRWEPDIRAIEEARLRRCWTLRRLSREARLSYPTVINLLLGRTTPNFATLDQLGGALGIAAADLIMIFEDDRGALRAPGAPRLEPSANPAGD